MIFLCFPLILWHYVYLCLILNNCFYWFGSAFLIYDYGRFKSAEFNCSDSNKHIQEAMD